ncbi:MULTISPECIES: glycosyltransferase family 39 protein [unclassified Leptolyngbya]|uniref:glycosyltransferase family 39 protein n=1 Tax=unclassified Leptolyngbya TaxID=2650499 RepID=UPI001688C2F6|nr:MULTISPECIES: glycosyltransferase family 39 protein [unclassified Leptolyngbya]MBD1913558.1 glycosyltransferase family 39 protein [Leptolyngbya sp. FACHB-8]MBD2155871.1 glycosyltransferase family 39 protein [Leptolyngbya sp. FACHB-16]
MPARPHPITTRRIWLGICGVLLVLGIFFRFYHLGYKVYWIDEVNTTLRSLGYTTALVEDTLLTGKPFTVADLQSFQQLSPERGWDDTWNSLRGSAEHTPLYFLLSRWWVERFGSTIVVWRSLAAVLSLLTFPALFWLCWELFQTSLPGWLAIGLVAVSPLHVLYAQEARPYSLLALMTLLSCASLLWGMRTQRWHSWIVYGMTIALGLYTQLLFGLVAIAHTLYILLMEGRLTQTVRRFSVVTAGAIAAFTPWLFLLAANLATVQRKTASLSEATPFSKLVDGWFRVLNQMLIDWELAGWNVVLVVGAIVATVILIRYAPRRAWLLLVLVGGVSFLGLALPDLVVGGERSLRVRYLFPTALSLQIALAYSFSRSIPAKTTWQQWGQGLLVVLLVSQIASCAVTSQKNLWWNKSRPRSTYYQPVSAILNQATNPLVLTESKVSDLLALSYWLRPNLMLQAIPSPEAIDISSNSHTFYLLNGSSETQAALTRQGYTLLLLYPLTPAAEVRLWQIQP